MSLRTKFFAMTYDRQIAGAEKAGLHAFRERLLAEPRVISQPQRDQALAQHVLHRLPEPQVDTERQRRDQFGQPGAGTAGTLSHQPSVTLRRPGAAGGEDGVFASCAGPGRLVTFVSGAISDATK